MFYLRIILKMWDNVNAPSIILIVHTLIKVKIDEV